LAKAQTLNNIAQELNKQEQEEENYKKTFKEN
jgi:hypothetical protein